MPRKIRLVWCLVIAAFLAFANPASATAILHFEDDLVGTSSVPGALALLGLTGSTTRATSVDDFQAKLESGGPWDIVIFGEQDGLVFTGMLATDLTAFVSGGGHVLGATWRSDSGFAALMQADVVDTNALTVTTDASPVFAGMGPTITLFNPGWVVTWTQSWSPIDSAVAAGTLGEGAAVIIGNEGRTILQGPLFDAFEDLSVGNRFVANEIRALCTPTTCEAQGSNCGTIPDGCGGTLTCGSCADDDNPCTLAPTCEAGRCQYAPGNAGTLCRLAAGPCDVAETCSGTEAACPPDEFRTADTVCRPSAGVCDVAESCTGDSPECPVDAFAPPGTVCRLAAGDCDVDETCAGTDPACPADQLEPAGTVCRPASGPCDEVEVCDGAATACPPDAVKPENATCDDDNPETGTSSCQAQECVGVTTTVDVPAEVDVPPDQPPGKVKIPVGLEIPATGGPKKAQVVLEGLVDCRDLPEPIEQCTAARASVVTANDTGRGFTAGAGSVFIRVTPRLTRNLGRTQSRSLTVRLPLNKLGRILFARLQPDEPSRFLPVQVSSRIRDRRGRSIQSVAQSLLARRRQP